MRIILINTNSAIRLANSKVFVSFACIRRLVSHFEVRNLHFRLQCRFRTMKTTNNRSGRERCMEFKFWLFRQGHGGPVVRTRGGKVPYFESRSWADKTAAGIPGVVVQGCYDTTNGDPPGVAIRERHKDCFLVRRGTLLTPESLVLPWCDNSTASEAGNQPQAA